MSGCNATTGSARFVSFGRSTSEVMLITPSLSSFRTVAGVTPASPANRTSSIEPSASNCSSRAMTARRFGAFVASSRSCNWSAGRIDRTIDAYPNPILFLTADGMIDSMTIPSGVT